MQRIYFVYLIIMLMFVQLINSYISVLPGAIPSRVIGNFLSGNPEEVANSIFAFGTGIATIGFYFVFFNQYLSDKVGRKKILVITTFGMALTTLLMIFTGDFIQYIILFKFMFFLCLTLVFSHSPFCT